MKVTYQIKPPVTINDENEPTINYTSVTVAITWVGILVIVCGCLVVGAIGVWYVLRKLRIAREL